MKMERMIEQNIVRNSRVIQSIQFNLIQQIIILNQLMNEEELYHRQQQIYRLHKKIRQYKLTPEESLQLQRNQEQQEVLIESKFVSSKINTLYKFPKMVTCDESPLLGFRDRCDLNEGTTVNSTMEVVKKKEQSGYVREVESVRAQKSQESRFVTEFGEYASGVGKNEIGRGRESYSPRNLVNKVFFESRIGDKKKQNAIKVNHYLSTSNDKTYQTLRMMTDSCELKSSKQFKNEPMCQSIKSIVKVKSGIAGVKKKENTENKNHVQPKDYQSTGGAKFQSKFNKSYKNVIGNKGKQNENKSRYGVSKKAYCNNYTINSSHNSNSKIFTEHDKSLKEWNRSFYNTNGSNNTYGANKSINGLYASVKSKESLLNTHKWMNTTVVNDDCKTSISKQFQNKKSLKKKQPTYKDYNNHASSIENKQTSSSSLSYSYNKHLYKSSLNQTSNLKSRVSETKQDINFSKVFQNLRGKNSESLGSEALYSSCSRMPVSSPLSYKYMEYRHGLTLTNR